MTGLRSSALTILILTGAIGCGSSTNTSTPVAPTIGTIATLQGTVMSTGTYTPLAGVVISISGVTLTTSLDGTYAISGLRPGDAMLTAERQGFRRFSALVHLEGARTVNIYLVPS